MIRRAIFAASALVLAGCTVVSATQRSLALVQPVLPQAGEVLTYSALSDVPGPMEVVREIEIANDYQKRPEIERRLRELAAQSGANAIVLHPNNRWKLGAAYTTAREHSFDPFRYSRATAIRVSAQPYQVVDTARP